MKPIKKKMVAGIVLNGPMSRQHQKFKRILHFQIFHGWKMVMFAFLNLLLFLRFVKINWKFPIKSLFSISLENSISDKNWLIPKHGESIKELIKSLMSVVDSLVSAMDSGKARRQPWVTITNVSQGFRYNSWCLLTFTNKGSLSVSRRVYIAWKRLYESVYDTLYDCLI